MRFELLPVIALLATTLPAQTEEVEVKALSNISVIATSGSKVGFNTISPGNLVKADFQASHSNHLNVNANANSATGYASIGAGASVWRSDERFRPRLTATFLHSITVSGDGTGAFSSSPSQANAKPGPLSYLVTFRAPANVRGNARIHWEGRTQTTAATAGASVDVGNDNSVEFVGDAKKSNREERFFPVSFAKGPVVVKVTFTQTGSTPQTGVQAAWQRLRVSMVKTGSCTVTKFGNKCGGAQLDAGMIVLGNTGILSLKMTGGTANGFFIRVAGTQRVSAPLPGGCTLYSSPEVVELLRANAKGEFTEAFTLKADINWNVVFQYIPFDVQGNQLVLKATNGQEANCSGF